MCGLFGIYFFNKRDINKLDKGILLNLANANYPRGPKSAGFITLYSKNVGYTGDAHVVFPDFVSSRFSGDPIWSKSFQKYLDQIDYVSMYGMLGHCRAPTGGGTDFSQPHILNIEPYVPSRKFSVFAHNGMVLDFVKLVKRAGIAEDRPNLADTIYLHHIIDKEIRYMSIEDILSSLSVGPLNVPGSYSFWMFRDNTLYIGRCQGTIYYEITDHCVVFSSTKTAFTPNLMNDGELFTITSEGIRRSHFEVDNPLL